MGCALTKCGNKECSHVQKACDMILGLCRSCFEKTKVKTPNVPNTPNTQQ